MARMIKIHDPAARAWIQTTPVYDVVPPLTDLAQGAIWREFRAGTHLLRDQIGHFSADLDAVARNNLYLLHQDFNKSLLYRECLSSLRKSTQINWRLIAHEQNLICGLLHIPSGSSIDLNEQPSAHNCQSMPHLVNSASLCMFYVINGKLIVLADQIRRRSRLRHFWHGPALGQPLDCGSATVIMQGFTPHTQLYSAQLDTELLVVSYAKH